MLVVAPDPAGVGVGVGVGVGAGAVDAGAVELVGTGVGITTGFILETYESTDGSTELITLNETVPVGSSAMSPIIVFLKRESELNLSDCKATATKP